MKRIPIITRVPIQSQDLLKEDSQKSTNAINELVDYVESTENLGVSDRRVLIEDAFTRRFASLYALKYKPIKSKPLTFISKKSPFKHRPWQEAILNDTHPNKVVEKSRQLGLSELNVTEVIHFLDVHENTKAMYTFPRSNQMQDFSKTRVAPVFFDSPYLNQLLSDEVNNVSTKKIGSSYLFMRSAWGGALGEGADIDCAFFDEYDRMKEGVELAFQEGLKSSPYGYIRRFSTPTIPSHGVNGLYQKSDQMRYFHTCPHCGHKQFLTSEDNVIQVKKNGVNNITQEIEDGTFIIGCRKCGKELDRWGIGEWVSMYPSIKEVRGYHISQLDACWISADDIMRRKFNYTSKQLFHNYVLGEAYANEGLVIYEGDVKNCIRLPYEVTARTSQYPAVVAGIDWGEPSWMYILGIRPNGQIDTLNVFWCESNPTKPLMDASTFAALLRPFKPNLIIADAGYGADKNSFMLTQFPVAFYACQWQTNKDITAKTRFKDQWNEKAREVTVDKTVSIQRVLHSVKNGLIGMFPWTEKTQLIAKHLGNIRILDEEDEGIIYQKATRIGADHLGCCLAYALIGVNKITNYGILNNNTLSWDFI